MDYDENSINVSVNLIQKAKKDNILSYKKFIKNQDYQSLILDPLSNFRGKQQILFLKIYLKRLYDKGELSEKIYQQFKIKITLENPSMADKILSNLSSYAYTPSCLKEFLSEFNNRSSSSKAA